ncbi:MAG: divergent PAP2 family protein [Chloroflexi bacterium]|nr:divergent PAP2 family protein [Chloroflexota bacterium]
MQDLIGNRTLVATGASWLTAQTVKPILYRLTKGRWDWRWLISAGGMPSSHAAAVSALATAVGIGEGLDSAVFAVSLVMAIVVIYDAAGVRRAASIQARILNQILDELFSGRPIAQTRLRELLGHTPFEVLVGAVLGVTMALLLSL